MERAAARLPVRKGDYVCVEAGTLHALTAGSLAYEIEYGSDFTYRFYDYNRVDELGKTRELHIPKALESIHLDRAPVTLPCKPGEWIQEENYEICRMQDRCFYKNSGEQIECISILKGFGECDGIPVHPDGGDPASGRDDDRCHIDRYGRGKIEEGTDRQGRLQNG